MYGADHLAPARHHSGQILPIYDQDLQCLVA